MPIKPDIRKIVDLIHDWNKAVENKAKTQKQPASAGNRAAEFDKASASKGGQDHPHDSLLPSRIIDILRNTLLGPVYIFTAGEKDQVSKFLDSIKEKNPDLAKETLSIVRFLRMLGKESPSLATEFWVELDRLGAVTHKDLTDLAIKYRTKQLCRRFEVDFKCIEE